MQCQSSPSHWPFFVALPRNHLREERLVCRTFGAGHMIGFPALRAWELFSGVPHDCYFQSPYGALHPPSKSGARSPAQVGFQVSKDYCKTSPPPPIFSFGSARLGAKNFLTCSPEILLVSSSLRFHGKTDNGLAEGCGT